MLGVALITVQHNMPFLQSLVHAVATALGFMMALVLLLGIRRQLDLVDVPRPMRGVPIALICAGLLAMAFMGFAGIKF